MSQCRIDLETFGGKNCDSPSKKHHSGMIVHVHLHPENLEDDFPFQTGDFQVPCQFSRVYNFG